MFDNLNKLEEEFPNYTFGTNKDGFLFVNGLKLEVNLKEKYEDILNILIKNKTIKKE